MRLVHRRPAAILAILVAILLGGGMVVGAGTASASGQCTGGGQPHDCEDPQQSGCSASGVTVAPAVNILDGSGRVLGTVELRWSNNCRTNWARVTPTALASGMDVTARVDRPDAFATFTVNGTLDWSDMLYGQNICAWATGFIGVFEAQTIQVC